MRLIAEEEVAFFRDSPGDFPTDAKLSRQVLAFSEVTPAASGTAPPSLTSGQFDLYPLVRQAANHCQSKTNSVYDEIKRLNSVKFAILIDIIPVNLAALIISMTETSTVELTILFCAAVGTFSWIDFP